ncbi:MAG: hypothetical protein WBB82_04970 [Limnothrix sp.]
MSHPNSPSSQPNPLETEAYIEELSVPTIDVAAIDTEATNSFADEEPDLENLNIEEPDSDEIEATAETRQAIAPLPDFPALAEADNNDGFLIARKLRQHNRELVKTVVQLEQALAESQERLQTHIARSRSADTLLDQQSENLSDTQAEIDRLNEALDHAKQEIRDHKAVITELNLKFKKSQIQLAQIERECSLLQESHSEQQHRLVAAEQEVMDLQSRLERQQRYTIQYKSALEQQQPAPEIEEPIIIAPKQSPVPKVSRIQPWSEQTLQPKPASPIVIKHEQQVSEPESPEIVERPVEEAPELVLPTEVNDELEQQLNALEMEIEAMSREQVSQTTLKVPQFSQASATPKVARKELSPRIVATPPSSLMTSPLIKNWPSPTLSPVSTQKKRASLAAVDLPSFPRR